MRFYADLHIHSKYSRATSRDCDLENLTYWGRKKGITVIGTGDFTHPAWFKEIQDKLIPAEPGLFRLKPDLKKNILAKLPSVCHGTTRFMLSVEISTIYKKGDKTRKIHHLVYAPDLEKAARINTALGKIGNIRSDGRPILGLDSRHLLEIVLEAGEDCYIVPAHIWTPWFAVLGSKSGFDDVAHCYGDLADHIFAVETGLSSDPEMNWRVSSLDRYRLMSNSDAHSPQKLGREVNVFDTELDYFKMKKALQTGQGYGGTLEFFPEEGKYHMDGHRACGVRLHPQESKAHNGLCPACKKPLTLGVLYRVEELADRPEHQKPEHADAFSSVIPLPEIVSEMLQSGVASQAVTKNYENLIGQLGPELDILTKVPLENIQKKSSLLMSEAISRMRQGHVMREAGYDGEYGRIKLFKKDELAGRGSGVLFDVAIPATPTSSSLRGGQKPTKQSSIGDCFVAKSAPHNDIPYSLTLDEAQQKALEITQGALLIVAGPGSGKTRTLTCRIAHLIQQGHAKPEECLTLTFTKKAAQEMQERLAQLLPKLWKEIPILTFHGLGLRILEENRQAAGLVRGFRVADESERCRLLQEKLGLTASKAEKMLKEISQYKRSNVGARHASPLQVLQTARDEEGWLDYDDLLIESVALLEEDAGLRAATREKLKFISIDEYQDIDDLQYRLIQLITTPASNICAIGDPDQAIYSFRGANVKFFLRFQKDFPCAGEIHLSRNYRSGQSILQGSLQMIAPSSLLEKREMEGLIGDTGKIVIHQAPTDKAEAEFVVHTIEQAIGGTSFFSMDSGRSEGTPQEEHAFSDFAILYRTEAQSKLLEEALGRSGIPYQKSGHSLKELEAPDPRAESVQLLTLHSAKGLEFSVVFITGCEEGLFPLMWGGEISEQALAEERRLFFVGMTRARSRLFLTHAGKRMIQGKIREQEKSRFLKDIEENLLELSRAKFRSRSKDPQFSLFNP